MGLFRLLQQAAKDFTRFSRNEADVPVLSIGGEKANGDALGKQVRLVASNAASVTLPDTGHWVMEERPQETTDALMRFLDGQPVSTAAFSAPARTGALDFD